MKRILLLATGGTIASRAGQDGLEPQPAPPELLHALEEELPLGGEAEDAVVEQAEAGTQRVAAVLHLAVLQQHRVARLGGREAVAALEKLV